MKQAIADILMREGFILGSEKKGKKTQKYLEVTLKYVGTNPEVRGVKRISKLGKRTYFGVRDIHGVKNGQGILVLSTPAGLKTDKEARKERLGGEALFSIW